MQRHIKKRMKVLFNLDFVLILFIYKAAIKIWALAFEALHFSSYFLLSLWADDYILLYSSVKWE